MVLPLAQSTHLQPLLSVQFVNGRGQPRVLTQYRSPGGHPATWRQIDYIGPLPSGNRVALCSVGIDIYCGYGFAFPARDASAKVNIYRSAERFHHRRDSESTELSAEMPIGPLELFMVVNQQATKGSLHWLGRLMLTVKEKLGCQFTLGVRRSRCGRQRSPWCFSLP